MFATIRSFVELYGKHAADLYDKASQQNEQAREAYYRAMDTYYRANQEADYGEATLLWRMSACAIFH